MPAPKLLVAVALLVAFAVLGGAAGLLARQIVPSKLPAPLPAAFSVTLADAGNCPCVGGGTKIALTWNPSFLGVGSSTPGGWVGMGNFGGCGHQINVAVFWDLPSGGWRFQFSFPDGCNGGINANAISAATFDQTNVNGLFPIRIELPQCGCANATATITATITP